MTDHLWSRLGDIVLDALDLPPAERAAFLDGVCRTADGRQDADLRREAESLLAAHEDSDDSGWLQSPVTGIASTAAGNEQVGQHAVPDRIGAWRIGGVLGEGGMGIVYRASRDDGAFTRDVALKRLRPGHSPGLAERLDAERRMLARLEHPGIARLYDGGVDAEGAPFLVMECVDGEPLTDFADHAGLDVAGRIRLFAEVCAAVSYAHQHLVVHRDLKPSNVFVTSEGQPKLLDFGVAKLLDDEPDPDAPLTVAGAMTPAYAAPEQVRGGTVTTATDVYALGVLLYELLAGERPYHLSGLTASEIEQAICVRVPPPPSTLAPADRVREVRGDLDTVVQTAMAKEPSRRYATADALADDLRRILDGVPITARPASRAYRARLFARRHRAAVAGAVAVLIALLGGLATTTWQARVARAETDKAEAVQDFMLDMLGAADPNQDGRDVRVADLLDQAAAGLDSAFADQPDVRADAHLRLGQTYLNLGLLPESEAQYRRALALRERLDGPRSLSTAAFQRDLGTVLVQRAEYEAADSLFALSLATTRRLAGDRDPRTARVLAEIGTMHYIRGETGEAESAYREVLAIEEATLAPDDPELVTSIGNLAAALGTAGETEEATALIERQVALLRAANPVNQPTLAHALANLGAIYVRAERYDEAVRVQTESVRRSRAALGNAHPSTAFGLSNLGSTLTLLGRPVEAEPLLRESAAIYRAASGATHPDVGYPLVNLGKALRDQGRFDEAEAAVREADRLFLAGFGPDHWTRERIEETLASIAEARR